jgi:hypothetical protein
MIYTRWALGECVEGRGDIRKATETLSGEYGIEIKKWSEIRNNQQNALYWKWLSIIGADLGYHKNELHEVFLDKFSDTVTHRDLSGKPVQRKVRSSAMTKKRFSEYMDSVYQFASTELGITLPTEEE